MVRLELTDDEATILRAVLEAHVRDLPREIHVTHDRAFKQVLKQKEAALERVLEQLARVSR
jgi:predicted amidohydrolase YtcJ